MFFSSVHIHIRVKKNPKEKKHIASQGFSNKSKKPRKKNLNAGGNITTPRPSTTPNTIRGSCFFNLFIILSINYNTNIRNLFHISKSFNTFFYPHFNSLLSSPTHNHPKDTTFFPNGQIKWMTMCHEYEDLPFFQ